MKTGLFWFLHRAMNAAFWGLWIVVALFLYSQRAAFQPARDGFELWWHRPSGPPADLPLLSGRVTRLFGGDSFQFRDDQGVVFNYGLAGVRAPKAGPNATAGERLAAGQSLTNLARLIMGERVEIQVTLANPQTRTGLGLVRAAGTNVNEHVLRGGWGSLKRDQIRVLPLRRQYELVRAERLARKERAGLWAGSSPAAEDGPRPPGPSASPPLQTKP